MVHRGEHTKVERARIDEAHADELAQQPIQDGPALEDALVKDRTLLAGQAAKGHKERPPRPRRNRASLIQAPVPDDPLGRSGPLDARRLAQEHRLPGDALHGGISRISVTRSHRQMPPPHAQDQDRQEQGGG